MIQWNKDDLFYVCSMIEFVARKTHNRDKDIVSKLSDNALKHQLKAASVNHCLSFEQVSDEWIEEYQLPEGIYDNISTCRYEVPTVTAIGRVYQTLTFFNLTNYLLHMNILNNLDYYSTHWNYSWIFLH